jgi:hypothetical protein
MSNENLYPVTCVRSIKTFLELIEKNELKHKVFLRRRTKEDPYRLGYEVNLVKPEHLQLVMDMFKWFGYKPVVHTHKSGLKRLRVRSNSMVSGFMGLQYFRDLLEGQVEVNTTIGETLSQYLRRMEEKQNKQLVSIDEDLPF